MMDKRKNHDAVDKCSLEKQFHKSDGIIFAVYKQYGATYISGLLAGCKAVRLADKTHIKFKF